MKLLAKVLYAALTLLGVFLAVAAFMARKWSADDCPTDERCEIDMLTYSMLTGLGLAGFGASAFNFVIWPGFKEMNSGSLGYNKANFVRATVLCGIVVVVLLIAVTTASALLATGGVSHSIEVTYLIPHSICVENVALNTLVYRGRSRAVGVRPAKQRAVGHRFGVPLHSRRRRRGVRAKVGATVPRHRRFSGNRVCDGRGVHCPLARGDAVYHRFDQVFARPQRCGLRPLLVML